MFNQCVRKKCTVQKDLKREDDEYKDDAEMIITKG